MARAAARPRQSAASYAKFQQFWTWATTDGNDYDHVMLANDPTKAWYDPTGLQSFDIRDVNRNGVVDGSGRPSPAVADPGYISPEDIPNDIDGDGWISDDERDEDADGLTNYEETVGRMNPKYWEACYSKEKVYPIAYAGTRISRTRTATATPSATAPTTTTTTTSRT